MLKFDEQKQINSVNGGLALRGEIERVVDEIQEKGFDGIYFIGIGGTWASSLQAEVYMRGRSALPVYVENAAEFITTGNKRFTKDSIVIFSSVTGNTEEMVKAVEKAKEIGAKVFGFVDKAEAEIVKLCDWCISYPENEQLKFYMTANRLMYNNGEFPEYDRYNKEMEEHLAEALVNVEKKADAWAAEYAKEVYAYVKANPDMPHYFVGSGNQWGATYSYAMCYWEEQLWIRTKSITCAEFFHGMLEVVEAETPVTLFMGEDSQRPLAERVAGFLPKVCKNYVVIDSKDYELEGISTEFRGSLSHLVMHAVNNRVDAHLEDEFRHPMVIRRYYRQFEY
ncbi:SIS domain-containing protein [Schaedlerella arabinosiphila]|uniref:SIS domain-containing protein n=1 Tax=Schaedlerella arabinosiphila TaxID=2044587 RepID=A0A9X5H3W3_9FIRM|nr:SIS domain-containing protein [Schaedlerella arabinosiphila]KAI4439539.1 Fructosamine deglycase FrlB [Schaedlerella arabinosiphila]MCI9604536.1 SIS domain-containing protein [Ruminococcus sp.]MCI9633461.1 SIS domain-containing protein [Ruminococcus sp.]NDO67807.1 SIS domain-containing protein [Schaedlerella arabinosiphila]